MVVRAVLGLMQDPTNKKMLLVRKATGDVAGRFGLPAGNLRNGETPVAGIIRKFEEELGIKTTPEEWKLRLTYTESEHKAVFVLYNAGNIYRARTNEDEYPFFLGHDVALAREPLLPDLQWMIPFLLHYTGPDAAIGE